MNDCSSAESSESNGSHEHEKKSIKNSCLSVYFTFIRLVVGITMAVTISAVAIVSECLAFGGKIIRCSCKSKTTDSVMKFSIFQPPGCNTGRVPYLIWLSGLECTDENFLQKGGALRVAAELGILLVMPDTSPRDTDIPGEKDSWDFGSGAGFYVNATEPPWSAHYCMYDFVVTELRELVEANFSVMPGVCSISGHSMGGHGALTIALKNPSLFASVSAFAPICHPTTSPWGQKAFAGYLGSVEAGKAYDATELITKIGKGVFDEILIDQGLADRFMETELKPRDFADACRQVGQKLSLRFHQGYDHGYNFISSFVEGHLRFHMKYLSKRV